MTQLFVTLSDGRPVLPGDPVGYAVHKEWRLTRCDGPRAVVLTTTYATSGPDADYTETFRPEVFGLLVYGPDGKVWPEGDPIAPVVVIHPGGGVDRRYTVGTSFTGECRPERTTGVPGQVWVVHFAGEWVGAAPTEQGGWALATYHAMQRQYRINGH